MVTGLVIFITHDEVALGQVGGLLRGVHTFEHHPASIGLGGDLQDSVPTAQVFTQYRRLLPCPGIGTHAAAPPAHTNVDIAPTPIGQVHRDVSCHGEQIAK